MPSWADNYHASRSLHWLRTEWLTHWATVPGAHMDPSPETLRGAREAANRALSECAVWVHHRNRVTKTRGRVSELDVLWGVAMRCARGAAHFAMCQGRDPHVALAEHRRKIQAKAGKLDVPEDPFKDALS